MVETPTPAVCVSSSIDGQRFARAIARQLEDHATVMLWDATDFDAGGGTLESRLNTLERLDFAIVVLTADDPVTSRQHTRRSPRDNFLFELGLFIGRLGRFRTFVVYEQGSDLRLPSSLAGISLEKIQPRKDGNLSAAVSLPCATIIRQVRQLSTNVDIAKALGDDPVAIRESATAVRAEETGSTLISENAGTTSESPVRTKQISEDQAFERIGSAVRLNLTQLDKKIEQARRESNQCSNLTIIFSSTGFVIIMLGIALLFFGSVTAGIVATISSIIPEVTALFFCSKGKELRRAIEVYYTQVIESQRMLGMVDVAETMDDHTGRDGMKREIVRMVLRAAPPLQHSRLDPPPGQ